MPRPPLVTKYPKGGYCMQCGQPLSDSEEPALFDMGQRGYARCVPGRTHQHCARLFEQVRGFRRTR